jgi:hypothetical protein
MYICIKGYQDTSLNIYIPMRIRIIMFIYDAYRHMYIHTYICIYICIHTYIGIRGARVPNKEPPVTGVPTYAFVNIYVNTFKDVNTYIENAYLLKYK